MEALGNDGRLTGLEEDPSCGGGTEDCVDNDMGYPEPGGRNL